MSIRKNRWFVACAAIALVSVAVNVYLLWGSTAPMTTAATGGASTQPVSTASAVREMPGDAAAPATAPINPALVEMLDELRQSVRAMQEQIETLALRTPAKPEKSPPNEEEIARREAKRAEMRERMMLDLPEEERAVRQHERWLRKNQEEVAALARELEQLKQLSGADQ